MPIHSKWQIMHLFVGMVHTWMLMLFSRFFISSHMIHSALESSSFFSRKTCNFSFSFVVRFHLSYLDKFVCIEWVFNGLRIRFILQVSLLIILKLIFLLFLLTIIVTLQIFYSICFSWFLRLCLSIRSWFTKSRCLMPLAYQILTICIKWSFLFSKRCGPLVIRARSEIRSRMTAFSEFHTFLLMQLTEFNYFSFRFVLIFFGYFFMHLGLYLRLWFLVQGWDCFWISIWWNKWQLLQGVSYFNGL